MRRINPSMADIKYNLIWRIRLHNYVTNCFAKGFDSAWYKWWEKYFKFWVIELFHHRISTAISKVRIMNRVNRYLFKNERSICTADFLQEFSAEPKTGKHPIRFRRRKSFRELNIAIGAIQYPATSAPGRFGQPARFPIKTYKETGELKGERRRYIEQGKKEETKRRHCRLSFCPFYSR